MGASSTSATALLKLIHKARTLLGRVVRVDGRVARGEMGVIDRYGGDERSPSPADRRMLRVFGQIKNADLSREDSQIRHSIRHRLRVLAEDGVLLIPAVIYDALGCQGVGDLRSRECSGHAPEHPFVEPVNIVVGTHGNGHSRAGLNLRLRHIRQVRRDLLPPRTARNQSNHTHQFGLPFHSTPSSSDLMGTKFPRGGPHSARRPLSGELDRNWRFRRCGRMKNRPSSNLLGLQRLDVFRQIMNAQLRNRGRSTSTVQGIEQGTPNRHLRITVRGNVCAEGQSGLNRTLWITDSSFLGQEVLLNNLSYTHALCSFDIRNNFVITYKR